MNDRQRTILAHVVIDPQAWYDHGVATFGQEKADIFLAQKCRRWEGEYERSRKDTNYKTRAEREGVKKE